MIIETDSLSAEELEMAKKAGRFIEIIELSTRGNIPNFLLLHAIPTDDLLELAKICLAEIEYRKEE